MLAHWIKVSGTRKNNSKILKTDSFNIKEVVLIVNVLLIKFNIKSNIHNASHHPVIYIKTASKKRIKNKLKPFMCESKLYKLENR